MTDLDEAVVRAVKATHQKKFDALMAAYGSLRRQRDELDRAITQCERQMEMVDQSLPLSVESAMAAIDTPPETK